jgi:hypothetical protein
MAYPNIINYNHTPYLNNMPAGVANFIGNSPISPNEFNFYQKNGWLSPLQSQNSQQTQAQPQAPMSTPGSLQSQFNRLTGQASDALNGGLLGYMPSQLVSSGSNPQTFNAPQGSFRFPFGLLNGQGG